MAIKLSTIFLNWDINHPYKPPMRLATNMTVIPIIGMVDENVSIITGLVCNVASFSIFFFFLRIFTSNINCIMCHGYVVFQILMILSRCRCMFILEKTSILVVLVVQLILYIHISNAFNLSRSL